MLRKAFAGLLSALLIGAASLAPSVVNAQSQANAVPTGGNTVVGNWADYTYGGPGAYENPGGSAGGAWWGTGWSEYKSIHNGTVNHLAEYADCVQYGAGTGFTCANGANGGDTLGIYVNGTLAQSCTFTYPGTAATAQWVGCDIPAVTIVAGEIYQITSSVSAVAAAQAFAYGIGGDSANSKAGSQLSCTHTGTLSPNPPTSVPTTAANGCGGITGGTDTINLALVGMGTITDTNNPKVPVGTTQPQPHTTTVTTHKMQLYRYNNVPGNDLGIPVQELSFYADSTSTSTGWLGAIFTDVSDTPTKLVGECNEGSPNNPLPVTAGAWNGCSIAPMNLTPGNSYWLAIWNADGTNSLVLDDQTNGASTSECLTSASTTSPLASTFVTTGDATCTNVAGMLNAVPFVDDNS